MIHAARALGASVLLVSTLVAGAAMAEDAPVPDGANIVNGIPTHLQPTTGALLVVGPDLKNQFLDCSGVLIGCRTVLTAAHCICKDSPTAQDCIDNVVPDYDVSALRFFFQHSGFHHVRDIYIDPEWVPGVRHDLAMLRLSEAVTGIEPAQFHKTYPLAVRHDTPGIITGFGNSGDDELDAAIKRVGAIETAACVDDTGILEPVNICWNYTGVVSKPGDEANLCLNDDGGPLFIDYGDGPEVTGIHAGGGSTCDASSYSYDTNVSYSREWITNVGGLDVTRDQCSDLGEVGEPWVVVAGGEGNLPKSQDQKLFAFDVPKDALVLRVSVNGDTEKDGDYDMYVGLNQKIPTKDDNDCASTGVGQFGFCQFDETAAQRVNVLIQHVKQKIGKGHSRFQVTVTAFRPVPPREDPPRGPDALHYVPRSPGFKTLRWIDDSTNEKGFELQRRPGTDPAEPFVLRDIIRANRTDHLEEIPDDQIFTYRIRAFNDFGQSEWSNLCTVNKRLPRPTRLRPVEITADHVKLRWRDNSDGESGMEVQRRLAGTLRWKTIKTLAENTRTTVDGNVDPGLAYQYRVRALGFPDQCIPHSRFSRVRDVTTS